MNGDVRVVDDVAQAFVDVVVAQAPRSLALSGGDTARACYERLRGADMAWDAVDVLFGDERWVPVEDPESNEKMAREVLLDAVHPRAIHSMRNAGATPEAAAAAYDALLHDMGSVAFNHLGMGPDGHTASLFPGTAALEERDRLVVPNGDDAHPHPRLTFTFPAIARSDVVVFTVSGADKRDAFARVKAGDDLPAARVTAPQVLWLVDPAAAGEK